MRIKKLELAKPLTDLQKVTFRICYFSPLQIFTYQFDGRSLVVKWSKIEKHKNL